jgi:hypothetical protein
LRSGLRPYFLNIRGGREAIHEVFKDFSIFETVTVILYSISLVIYRCFKFIGKLFTEESVYKKESRIFTRENFLNSEGRFAE